MTRVTVGVDPSLSNTGVAIIHDAWVRPAFRGIKVSHIPGATGPEYEAERIELMASRVWRWISQEADPENPEWTLQTDSRYDVWFVLEGPITGGYAKSGKQDERAGLRWRLIAHFRRHGRVMLVNPKHVKKYWAGHGLPPAAPQVDRSILPMIEWPPTTTKETE
jgi:hypothetical protein